MQSDFDADIAFAELFANRVLRAMKIEEPMLVRMPEPYDRDRQMLVFFIDPEMMSIRVFRSELKTQRGVFTLDEHGIDAMRYCKGLLEVPDDSGPRTLPRLQSSTIQ